MEDEEEPKKKEKKAEDPPDGGGADFMMLFSALSIILLAFFILLTSMASLDNSKKKVAMGSLMGSFGILPGGMNLDSEGKTYTPTDLVADDVIVFQRMLKDVELLLQDRGLSDPGEQDITADQSGMFPRITLSSDLVYEEGDTEVSPAVFPVLDRLAQAASEVDATIIVEGHTSSQPPPKNVNLPSNWELSAHRAMNVQRYLVHAAGLPPERVEAQGLSHYRQGKKPQEKLVIVFKYTGPSRRTGLEDKSKAKKEEKNGRTRRGN